MEELVRRARDGDIKAFEGLVEAYKNKGFALSYSILGDRYSAEDVLQEAFIKAWRSLRSLRNISAFNTWFMRIIINLSYNEVKKRRREVSIDDFEDLVAMVNMGAEDKVDIQKALKSLSVDHRAILILREIDGLSYEEIADVLGIPLGTVKSRINAARMKMREILKEEG
ncbi:MAG: RNA polymerase sigma factor [Thermoanaerobacteraceae bacterium]|nr:RNA polymerase sigma factor [Thermoanaerobacteraceae bacterium]